MKKLIVLFSIFSLAVASCSTGSVNKNRTTEQKVALFTTNDGGEGPEIIVELKQGESFYYPLFAIWIEDIEGRYIQTLYVSKSVATGIFRYATVENNKWVTGEKRAPQTLPYWAHKRGVKASDGLYMPDSHTAVPDAYTGATPVTGFIMNSRADGPLPDKYKVMLEINQNWDWNDYWTNDKYPGDENYKWLCQPALVYEAVIDARTGIDSYTMKPVGHSHYSGATGELFSDLNTLTTALKIADLISVKVK